MRSNRKAQSVASYCSLLVSGAIFAAAMASAMALHLDGFNIDVKDAMPGIVSSQLEAGDETLIVLEYRPVNGTSSADVDEFASRKVDYLTDQIKQKTTGTETRSNIVSVVSSGN